MLVPHVLSFLYRVLSLKGSDEKPITWHQEFAFARNARVHHFPTRLVYLKGMVVVVVEMVVVLVVVIASVCGGHSDHAASYTTGKPYADPIQVRSPPLQTAP
jgi:hypothetical protein